MTREAIGDGIPDYVLIELMFFAYRDFVADADAMLADRGFGRAHHRVLHFVSRRPGLSVAELLDILRITKQSLNRVLKDLVERDYVAMRPGSPDRRQRRLLATAAGEALIDAVARVQSARLNQAIRRSGATRDGAARLLAAMVEDVNARDGPRLP